MRKRETYISVLEFHAFGQKKRKFEKISYLFNHFKKILLSTGY